MYQPSVSVLVVEKNPELRKILQEALSSHYRVSVLADTTSAFGFLFRGDLPELIILGYYRDQIEAQDLLFELRQNGFFKRIPLLLLTDDPQQDRMILENGSPLNYLIRKPFDPLEILRLSEKILEQNEQSI